MIEWNGISLKQPLELLVSMKDSTISLENVFPLFPFLFCWMVSGSPFGKIIPTRGLHQWDPLSSYLSTLGAEFFSRVLVKTEREGFIHGAKIAKGDSSISHLLFEDDSFIFFRVCLTEAREVKNLLEDYCEMSGQLNNYHKLAVYFRKCACQRWFRAIVQILGMRLMGNEEKYLGNPLILRKKIKI